jgi:RNA polymerase sigma-70 factor (TIGR02960 family)
MIDVDTAGGSLPSETALLESAVRGDSAAFDRLVEPYRRELHAHCYRMLGSVHDADDALQEALLGAWRGLATFGGHSTLRSSLYRIATDVCLRMVEHRPKRLLSNDYLPATHDVHDLGEPVGEAVWLEPYPLDPEASYEQRESVELAFVAALQHLPATQRAVLILREVLAFSASEVAAQLDTTVASVNNARQRARESIDERAAAEESQQATLQRLGDDGRRTLVDALVTAFERADVDAVLDLLVEDARYTMPPLPVWFRGRDDIGRFIAERMFAAPWRMLPSWANGQPALACYQGDADGTFRLGAITVLSLRGDRVAWLAGFLDPALHVRFGLPEVLVDVA